MHTRTILLIALFVTIVLVGGNYLFGIYATLLEATTAAFICFCGGVGSLLVADILQATQRIRRIRGNNASTD